MKEIKEAVIRKGIVWGVAACLALSLSACAGGGSGKDAKPAASETSAKEEDAGETGESGQGVLEELMADDLETEEEGLSLEEVNEEELAEEETFSGEGDDMEFSVFSSEKMNFSFLYEPEHKAFITDTGAAQLAIGGDESLTGLFISVQDAANMPEVSQIIEEEKYNLQQKYQNAMAVQPEDEALVMEDHDLTGFSYAYSNEEGETVECTYYIDKAEGKYVFYETAALKENRDATMDALAIAMESLVPEAGYYGESDALSGSIE